MVSARATQPVAHGEVGTRRSWDDVYVSAESPAKMLRWVTTHEAMVVPLLGAKRVLEVGTGTGMLSGFLALAGAEVTTLDVSPAVLTVAQRFYGELGVEVRTVEGDGMATEFDDDSFDVVFSQGLWEHFGDDFVVRFAREGLRLAPVVYASVPSAFYPRLGRRGPGLVGNERLMLPSRWRRSLGPLGARVTARHYADWKLFTLGGFTVPYPNHVLIEVARHH